MFSDFLLIFQFFFNIIPHGSQHFKTPLLPQITFESFQTFFLNFFSTLCFLTGYVLEISRCIFDFRQPGISKTHGRRAKRVKFGPRGMYSVYTGSFWQLSGEGQSEVIRCIAIFGSLWPRKRQAFELNQHLNLYVIQFNVAIVWHLLKMLAKASGLLLSFIPVPASDNRHVGKIRIKNMPD